MTTNECVICGRPTPDGYADSACAAQAAQKLAAIVDLAPEARQVAYGLSRGSQGGASGKPGSRSPGNDDALDALSEVQNCLSGWARVVAEERGVGIPVAFTPDDQIVRAAEWLTGHIEWLRHSTFCDEAYRDFEQCARRIRGVVEGPRPKKYLGPCGAILECNPIRCAPDCPPGCGVTEPICEGDVYGPAGAKTGRCRTCKAEVDQAERRAWLDEQTRGRAYRAVEIEDAHGVKAHTIRMWADRGLIRVHGHDQLGRKLYLLGEVLDQAAEMARRRAENEAKRARRESVEMGA